MQENIKVMYRDSDKQFFKGFSAMGHIRLCSEIIDAAMADPSEDMGNLVKEGFREVEVTLTYKL